MSLGLLAIGFLCVSQKRHCHVQLVLLMRSSPPLMKESVCSDVFCWIRTLSRAAYICSPTGPLHQWPVFVQGRKGWWSLDWNALWIDCCFFEPSSDLFESFAVCLFCCAVFLLHGLYWSSEVEVLWADKWASRCKICDMDILGII